MIGSPVFRYALTPSWASNELWRRARAVPSLDLRFAESKSLVDATTGQSLVTFTRASSGTYVGGDGLIKTATTNEPRFDHNPTTGESLGLLVEEQRTNLLLQSEDFSTTWINTNSSETVNSAISPDGTLTADEIIENTATSSTHVVFQAYATTSGVVYTYSCFIKAGQRSFVLFTVNGVGTLHSVSVNLSTGTATSATGSPTNISSTFVGNGWYRVAFTYTSGTTGNVNHEIRLSTDGVWANRTYTGNGTGSVYVWGAQLEAGAFATSYIPTTTATVTRSADVASDTTRGGNIRSLYASFRSPASGTRPVVSLDDNTANERIELVTSGTDPKLLVTDGGSAVADLDAGTVTANSSARLAARFQTDDYAVSINGAASQLDAAGTLPTVNRIRIGSNQADGYLNGTIARIAGWDAVLPDLPQITQ